MAACTLVFLLAVCTLVAADAVPSTPVYPARRICRPGPSVPSKKEKYAVLIVGDSISLGAMGDLTPLLLAGGASVEHAPWSGDGGALDVKYAMDTDVVMTGAGTGPPWVPSVYHPDAVRYGDGCLNGTFLVTATQQPAQYDLISFNYGVHDVDYSGYNEEYVPLALYESNIRAVKKTLLATGAKVVFQASTPVEYNLTTNSRILAYNAAAKKVMAEAPTAAYNDLYKTITDICGQPPYVLSVDSHTLCTHTLCTHTLCTHTLCTHTLFTHTLFTHTLCTHTTLTLHSHCTHTILTLHSHYTHTTLTLYSHYTHTTLTLHTLCTHTH
jgi:hypothetical protein